MAWLFSAGLWALLIVALAWSFRVLTDTPSRTREIAVIALVLLTLAVPLYFRPHEEILGGATPGAYINAAAEFGRTGRLTYTDGLLAKVLEPERMAFCYGDFASAPTKDACLWIKDPQTAEIGPRFEPAYALLLCLPLRFLPAWCALYEAPVLTLLAAAALGIVGIQLLGRRRGGLFAVLFFLLNPLVLWNGRCPCTELGALVFFWLGLALLVRAWRSPGERRIVEFLLGALCLVVFPFFHITAWFGVLPVAMVLLAKAMLGRRLFILIVPMTVVGVCGFLSQLVYATDSYHLLPRLRSLLEHPRWLALMAGAGLLTFLVLCGRLAAPARAVRPMADNKSQIVALVVWILLTSA